MIDGMKLIKSEGYNELWKPYGIQLIDFNDPRIGRPDSWSNLNLNGFCTNYKNIAINPKIMNGMVHRLDGSPNAGPYPEWGLRRILIHETAHILLGHVTDEFTWQVWRPFWHGNQAVLARKEVEAETATYITLKHLGAPQEILDESKEYGVHFCNMWNKAHIKCRHKIVGQVVYTMYQELGKYKLLSAKLDLVA